MLSAVEEEVKASLIQVCRGEIKTTHRRKITYKEIWEKHHSGNGKWGRGYTPEVVRWIVNISDYYVKQGYPPLNSIVVRQDTGEPGQNWDDWHKSAGSPYESLAHAQAACWAYWPEKSILAQFQS